MMKGVLPDIQPRVVIADTLYQFDRNLFGINDMPNEEIAIHARTVARKVVEEL